MSADIASVIPKASRVRSAVSNGSKLLANVDGRSATARRYRDLISDLLREGGEGALSAAEFGLVRQAAAITLQAELLQARIVRGEAVSAGALIRLSSEARRILASLRERAPAATGFLAEGRRRRSKIRAQRSISDSTLP